MKAAEAETEPKAAAVKAAPGRPLRQEASLLFRTYRRMLISLRVDRLRYIQESNDECKRSGLWSGAFSV